MITCRHEVYEEMSKNTHTHAQGANEDNKTKTLKNEECATLSYHLSEPIVNVPPKGFSKRPLKILISSRRAMNYHDIADKMG